MSIKYKRAEEDADISLAAIMMMVRCPPDTRLGIGTTMQAIQNLANGDGYGVEAALRAGTA